MRATSVKDRFTFGFDLIEFCNFKVTCLDIYFCIERQYENKGNGPLLWGKAIIPQAFLPVFCFTNKIRSFDFVRKRFLQKKESLHLN